MEKEKIPQQDIPTNEKDEEQLIPSEPKLAHIYKTLGLLEGYSEWKKDIIQKVGPWENSLQLFENVQKAVLEQVKDKIPSFQEKTPSIKDISKENIVDALVNNWFEVIPETKGQRREILLSVAAHVIKHMETKAYQEVITNVKEEELEKLGLNTELREVAVKILDASMRSDNLFIRFLAFSNLSPKPPKDASPHHFYLPNDKNPHTINELFPKDSEYISRKFKEISEMPVDWKNTPGGEAFRDYLNALSSLYREKDIDKIDNCQKKVEESFGKSILSDFPILITPSIGDGYIKTPYHDPELRVSLKLPEFVEEEKMFNKSQEIMADCLEENNYPELAEDLRRKKIKLVNSIGDYGTNLASKTSAQAWPVIIMYLNEQIKRFDEDFLEKEMSRIENLDPLFKKEKSRQLAKEMSRFLVMGHEYGHLNFKDNRTFERLGHEPSCIIDEVKAEQLYRWFVPHMIERGGLNGDKKQWASAILAGSLGELRDRPEKHPYYFSATYTLNRLFEQGVVEFDFEKGTASIKDVDAFYKINEELSKEVLGLYEDETMNEKKAKKWIKDNCKPNKIVEKVSKFIKGKE